MNNSSSGRFSWLFAGVFLTSLVTAVGFAVVAGNGPPQSVKEAALAPDAMGELQPGEAGDAAPLPKAARKNTKASGAKAAPIVWETSFESALERARSENKPVIVDFYTDWCSACKIMEKEVYPDVAVRAEAQKWVMVKVNAEKREDLSRRYKVTGFPTYVFLDDKGRSIGVLPAGVPAPAFTEIMQQAYDKWRPTVSM